MMISIKNFILLLVFIFSISNSKAQDKDYLLLKKINDQYTPFGGGIMRGFSDSDTYLALGIPTGLFIYGKVKKNPEMVWNSFESFSNQLINGVATTILKTTIDRARPFVTYPDDIHKHSVAGSKSYPSGHTSMAFAAATSISLQYPKWYVIAPAFIYASGVGYSRMYLGVHYPTDVLAGAVLGAGSSFVTHYTFKFIKKRWELKHSKAKI
ncbi:MAG: phosphatase PAP2 family protein [Fluviicola sp.]|nr:phosphatase PAP2 family protein [Fluviicola sp.]